MCVHPRRLNKELGSVLCRLCGWRWNGCTCFFCFVHTEYTQKRAACELSTKSLQACTHCFLVGLFGRPSLAAAKDQCILRIASSCTFDRRRTVFFRTRWPPPPHLLPPARTHGSLEESIGPVSVGIAVAAFDLAACLPARLPAPRRNRRPSNNNNSCWPARPDQGELVFLSVARYVMRQLCNNYSEPPNQNPNIPFGSTMADAAADHKPKNKKPALSRSHEASGQQLQSCSVHRCMAPI